MMTRKAYIDWNKLGKGTKLENKETYMVCTADGDTCSIRFATWYEKGTMVAVGIADDAKIGGEEPSVEERLLQALFGRQRPFVVPEDGFYVLTADYGVDEEEYNGAFEDCKEQLVCVGNRHGWDGGSMAIPAYWAEVPVLPDGLRLLSERRPAKAMATELTAKRLEEAEKGMEGDGIADQVYKYVLKDTPYDAPPREFPLGQAVYSVSPLWFATALLSVHSLCVAMSKVPEQAFLDFHDELGDMDDQAEIEAAINRFCSFHSIPRKERWLMFHYIRALREDYRDFYWHRDRILSKGGTHALDLVAVLQEARGLSKIQFWVARVVKMERLQAPEIIRLNELRMLVEYVAMARLASQIVCVRPDFDLVYGVHPDGSRGERWCECGDMELGMLPQPVPEDAEDEGDEDGDGDPGGGDEEEEEEGHVIGVDFPYFALTYAPNFMMRKHRFVIWDNAKHEYVRGEDGRIEGYDECPREKLAAMNDAARAAAGGDPHGPDIRP